MRHQHARWLFVILFGVVAALSLYAEEDDETGVEADQVQYYHSIPNIKPKKRELAFYAQRAFPYDRIPQQARIHALEYVSNTMHPAISKKSASLLSAQPQWKSIGPDNAGGRVRSIAIHPQDYTIVYIGTASGGIWRSKNAGASWEPIFDNGLTSSFGALAIDPVHPNTIFAGSGEMSSNVDSYFGNGLYKSVDAGNTWQRIGLANVGAFSKIQVHPLNSNLVVASANRGGAGFYKSTDGGTSWSRTFVGSVSDITLNVNDPSEFFIGVINEGIYYSHDGGEHWELKNNGIATDNIGRVSVQQARSNPNILYSLMERNDFGVMYTSTDHGLNWTTSYQDNSTANIFAAGFGSSVSWQGWYDQYIDIHPTNPSIAIAGGVDIYRTAGQSWENITQCYGAGYGKYHPDQQCIAFSLSNPDIVYAGHDGGISISYDAGVHWQPINTGLAITQFYALAIDQTTNNITYGGTQDNGSYSTREAPPDWTKIWPGDGGVMIIDSEDPTIIYGEELPGRLWRKNYTTGHAEQITDGIPIDFDPGYWVAPLILDPSDHTLYHGRANVYVSHNGGDSWTPLSSAFPKLLGGTTENITALAVSPLHDNQNSKTLYAGTSMGTLYVSESSGESWKEVSGNGLVRRFLSDILPSSKDRRTAYVAYSGFGTGHIFKTTDAGETWSRIDKDLPDIPCNTLVFDPLDENILYAGTDIGVFVTTDGGDHWMPFGEGLPRVPVIDLEFHKSSHVLYATTHGRSIWKVEVPQVTSTPAIISPAGGEIFTGYSTQTISWSGMSDVLLEYSLDDMHWNLIQDHVGGTSFAWKVPNITTLSARVRITSSTPSIAFQSKSFSIRAYEQGAILNRAALPFFAYGIAYDRQGSLWATSFYESKIYKINAQTLQVERSVVIPPIPEISTTTLFTDITIDRATQTLYIHRLTSSAPNGGYILALTTDGTLLRHYASPVPQYPIGLAWVDGKLIAGDRDGLKLYTIDPETGILTGSIVDNPFPRQYGPRGLCYDGKKYLYQASTEFFGTSFQEAYIVQSDKNALASATDSFELATGVGGDINARGIEYDPINKNFWVTDLYGNLYKIAGFDPLPDDVHEEKINDKVIPILSEHISPNPFSESAMLSFTLPVSAPVKIHVCNSIGSTVSTLYEGKLSAGEHSIPLYADQLASGVYTVIISVNDGYTISNKIIILK